MKNNLQDLTPKWKEKSAKEKILPLDSNFGQRIGGLGSPTVKSVENTQTQTDENTIAIENIVTDINILGWTSNLVFSSIDYNTVAWAGGNIILQDGSTFAITGGNTGNISAPTYIYFARDISTTTLQTSINPIDSVGRNKILVAVAQDNLDLVSDASFQVFGGAGGLLITRDGIAAGTITGDRIAVNTINVNQITAGTFIGFTFETATSGQRVTMESATNSFNVYDGSNNIVNIGSYALAVININLATGGVTNSNNGIFIQDSIGGVGFHYLNSTNVHTNAMRLEQTSTGANNDLACLDIVHAGHYFAQIITTSDAAGGLIIDHHGSSKGLNILADTTSGNVIDINNNGTGSSISIAGSSTATAIDLSAFSSSSHPALYINNTGATESIYLDNSNASTALPAIYINKTGQGTSISLYTSTNDANNNYGVRFDINNAGAGLEFAFDFQGAEIVSSGIGGSQDKKVRVRVGGTTYFIPLYTA